ILHAVPLRHCRSTLENAQVVDEQLAVEMVDLVLHAAREQLGSFNFYFASALVEGTNDNTARASDIAENFRYREASFLASSRSLLLDDLRIDECEFLSLHVHDCDSLGPSDLRRGKADTLGRIHGVEHFGDELSNLRRDFGDGFGLLPQNRIAEDPYIEDLHPCDADPAPERETRAMRPRSMIKRDSPDLMVILSSLGTLVPLITASLMKMTSPTTPPEVTTSSPFF